MRFGDDEKANLCLLGLVASPLQVLQIFGNLVQAAAHTAKNLNKVNKRMLLQAYKQKLVQQHRQMRSADTLRAQDIQLIEQGAAQYNIRTSDRAEAQHILEAERISTGWGVHLAVTETQATMQETEQNAFEITRKNKKSRTTPDTGTFAIIMKVDTEQTTVLGNRGDFLFQVLDKLSLTDKCIWDFQGMPVHADERIWTPGCYQVIKATCFSRYPMIRPALIGQGTPTQHSRTITRVADQGLTDATLNENALLLLDTARQSRQQYWPPIKVIEVARTFRAYEWIQEDWSTQLPLFGIIRDEGHWISYKADIHDNHLSVNIFDGLERRVVDYVDYFFHLVHIAMNCSSYSIRTKHRQNAATTPPRKRSASKSNSSKSRLRTAKNWRDTNRMDSQGEGPMGSTEAGS